MKTFTVAGYSVLKGETKFRVANDLATRIKVLNANGHKDVVLREIKVNGQVTPMTKEDAKVWFDAMLNAELEIREQLEEMVEEQVEEKPKSKKRSKPVVEAV